MLPSNNALWYINSLSLPSPGDCVILAGSEELCLVKEAVVMLEELPAVFSGLLTQ